METETPLALRFFKILRTCGIKETVVKTAAISPMISI